MNVIVYKSQSTNNNRSCILCSTIIMNSVSPLNRSEHAKCDENHVEPQSFVR